VSLADLLFASGWAPDDVIVHAGDEHATRAQLEDEAAEVAEALAELGVEAGAPVGVMMPATSA